jgi:hypothetical protein
MLIDEGRTSRIALEDSAGVGGTVEGGTIVGTGVAVGTMVGVGATVGVGGTLAGCTACCLVDTAPQAARPLTSSSVQSKISRVLLGDRFQR